MIAGVEAKAHPSEIRRTVEIVRLGEGQRPSHLAYSLVGRITVGRGYTVEIGDACKIASSLERRVRRCLGSWQASLPQGSQRRLITEVGRVTTWTDSEPRPNQNSYQFACWGGRLLCLATEQEQEQDASLRPSLPIEVREPADYDRSAPLVLAPSAVLTLTAWIYESRGEMPSSVELIDTSRSPYPPHDLPSPPGEPPSDHPLGSNSEGHDDPGFNLLTRPEQALLPSGISFERPRRNLKVIARRQAEPGVAGSAICLDALTILDGAARRRIAVAAELTWRRADRLSVPPEPLLLHLDPQRLLERCRGAVGRPQPALDRDPIERESFGLAPALLSDIPWQELLGAEV